MPAKRKREQSEDQQQKTDNSLRALDAVARHFWKASTAEQLAQTVVDQTAEYCKRTLPDNEVTVLALNEIARQNKYGYFMHLPSRQVWTNIAHEARLPKERAPGKPGPDYPAIVYMNYAWGSKTDASFLSDSQRGRYLRASAVASPPPASTPLYAIQFITQKIPTFDTKDSLVLYTTKTAFYLSRTSVLRGILGHDRDHPEKLAGAVWLWDRAALDRGRDSDERKRKDQAIQKFRLDTLEAVYFKIVDLCRSNDLPATMTGQDLQNLIPRPVAASAASVGSLLGSGSSADPPSRRGETYKRRTFEELRLQDAEPSWAADEAPAAI